MLRQSTSHHEIVMPFYRFYPVDGLINRMSRRGQSKQFTKKRAIIHSSRRTHPEDFCWLFTSHKELSSVDFTHMDRSEERRVGKESNSRLVLNSYRVKM